MTTIHHILAYNLTKTFEFRIFIRLIPVWILNIIGFHMVTSSNYTNGKIFECLGMWFWIS